MKDTASRIFIAAGHTTFSKKELHTQIIVHELLPIQQATISLTILLINREFATLAFL